MSKHTETAATVEAALPAVSKITAGELALAREYQQNIRHFDANPTEDPMGRRGAMSAIPLGDLIEEWQERGVPERDIREALTSTGARPVNRARSRT
jgi:hypothetical protein